MRSVRARLYRGAFMAALILASTVLLTGTATAQSGALDGLVTDAVTGAPIQDALVVARDDDGGGGPGGGGHHAFYHARTDANGLYDITDMIPGDYTVHCGALGYQLAEATATVADGQTSTVDFALQPLTFGSVAGTVTDASDGTPIAGAFVALVPDTGQLGGELFRYHAMTGPDGTYLIDNVLAGDYLMMVHAWGYADPAPLPVTVVDGQVTTADIALQPLAFGAVEGVVIDAQSGDPIEGAVVHAGSPWQEPGRGGESGHQTLTDANGFYRFDELPTGTWTIRAMKQGYEPAEADVDVIADQTAVVDFTLDPLVFGAVAGVVTDASTGLPIENAIIRLADAATKVAGPIGDGHGGWRWARTDQNGEYLIDTVPAGDYELRAWAFGFEPGGPVPVTVLDGQTATVDIPLQPRPQGAIEGVVTDGTTGEPVAGALVVAHPGLGGGSGPVDEHGVPWAVFTDDLGAYRIEGLGVGTWRVRVRARGYRPFVATADVVDDQTTTLDVQLTPR